MSVKVTSEEKELGSILKCHCRNKSPTCADCSELRWKLARSDIRSCLLAVIGQNILVCEMGGLDVNGLCEEIE